MVNTDDTAHKLMTAVYDFAVSRIAFDFFGFLVVAELARQNLQLDGIHLVVVPADGDGFHPNVQYELTQKQWRLKEIVIDGCWLLPSCRQLTVCHDRNEARRILLDPELTIYPEHYSIERPVARWETGYSMIEGHKGNDPRVLRASDQARRYVEAWKRSVAPDHQVVSLTLREALHNPQRNNELRDWLQFGHWLSDNGYYPVIVRDTETALLSDQIDFGSLTEFTTAAFNIDLRLALYELCFLNVNVANGPTQLCGLDPVTRILTFVTGDWLEIEPTPLLGDGVARGEPPSYSSKFQRWAWCLPDFENLKREFRKITEDLLSELGDNWEPYTYLPPDDSLRRDLLEIAMRFLEAREWTLFDEIAEQIVADNDSRLEIIYLQGLAANARPNQSAHIYFKKAIAILEENPKLVNENSNAQKIADHLQSLSSNSG